MEDTARPIGPLVDFKGAAVPSGRTLNGAHVRLEAMNPAHHGPRIWSIIQGQTEIWDYLYEAPPDREAALIAILEECVAKAGWQGYAICLPDGSVPGYAFYLNIAPLTGSIEVGNINFAPVLQRSVAATEAMYLMMREAFSLGYRRYEWKCNALNAPSRRAAQRLGFSWEGIFRQHLIVKGRNRDTAWLAITDQEWPQINAAFEAWLSDDNFDNGGQQRRSLGEFTAPARVAGDPAQAPLHRG